MSCWDHRRPRAVGYLANSICSRRPPSAVRVEQTTCLSDAPCGDGHSQRLLSAPTHSCDGRSRAMLVTLTSSLQWRLPSGPILSRPSGRRTFSRLARARSLPSTDCRSMRPNITGPRCLEATVTYRYRPSPMTTRRSGGSGSLKLRGSSNSGFVAFALFSKARSARRRALTADTGICRSRSRRAIANSRTFRAEKSRLLPRPRASW